MYVVCILTLNRLLHLDKLSHFYIITYIITGPSFIITYLSSFTGLNQEWAYVTGFLVVINESCVPAHDLLIRHLQGGLSRPDS